MTAPAEFGIPVSARGLPFSSSEKGCAERILLDRLVREHGDAVWRLAARLTTDPADAEDLVQDAWLRAFRGLPRFQGDAPRAWLYRILVNTLRSRRRRLPTARHRDTPARGSDPRTAAERRDLTNRVLAAVDALPRRQREAMLLRARGGLSYAEIAAVMRIRRVAVKSHLVLARRKLLARFGKEVAEWGIAP